MKRIVIKVGTSVLTAGTKRLNRPMLIELTRQCAAIQKSGHEVIVVTSGAIAAGREVLGYPDLPNNIANKQMLAAVGQSRLMQLWGQMFDIYGVNVGQMLLTRADVQSRQRYLNARDTILTLLERGIVPIVNENDAVADDEIKVGDNDNLSALVGILADADLLILLTDQEGLFSADPRTDPSAKLIAEVDMIDDKLKQLAGGSGTALGTGGMVTKLESAESATRAGITVIIASGHRPNVISRLVAGELHGTRFLAHQTPLENRQRWLLAGKCRGRIVVDAGAVNALVTQKRSLLPAGIVTTSGNFGRGDIVPIFDAHNTEFARGIVRYDQKAVETICGHQSNEIEPLLGYTYGSVVIHRNDLILL